MTADYGRGDQGQRTRRRTFTGMGRYPGTLQCVTAELNADGTDYVLTDGAIAPPPALLATEGFHGVWPASIGPTVRRVRPLEWIWVA